MKDDVPERALNDAVMPHTLPLLERQVYDAVHAFAQRGLVYMVEGPLSASFDHSPNGTGTLVRSPKGRIAVLTARHLLVDEPRPTEITLGGKGANGVADGLGRQWLHPDPDVDVALVELKPQAAASLGGYAFEPEIVASADDADVAEHHATIINGFPYAYRRRLIDHPTRTVTVALTSISYLTKVASQRDSRGRYRVQWGEAVRACRRLV